MSEFLQSYEITLKTISPIFIGSGLTIGKKEYIYERFENRILILDMHKFFQGLQKYKLLDAYQTYMMEGWQDLFFFLKDHKIDKKIYLKWVAYAEKAADQNLINKNTKQIKTFVKDAYGKPYIPGSSLKGMLRTILLSAKLQSDHGKKYAAMLRDAKPASKRFYLQQEDKRLDYDFFHESIYEKSKVNNEVNDIMSGFIVGDSRQLKETDLCVCQKVDYTVDGKEKKMPMLYECIKPGTQITFQISIDKTKCAIDKAVLLNAMDLFYENYRREFLECFQNYPKVLSQSKVLFLGGGVGYPSKTVTYAIMNGEEGKKQVGKILDQVISPASRRKHDHLNDYKKGASPHLLKCTIYENKLIQMGTCELLRWKDFAPHV